MELKFYLGSGGIDGAKRALPILEATSLLKDGHRILISGRKHTSALDSEGGAVIRKNSESTDESETVIRDAL